MSSRILVYVALCFSCGVGACRDNPGATHQDTADSAMTPSAKAQPQIIFRDAKGRKLTLQDLPAGNARLRWELIGGDNVPQAAQQLHAQARQAGAAGKHDQALALLKKASELAPKWPYPHYDAAYTQLLKGDDAEALRLYRKTLKLAPRGFYTAITAEHYLAQEAAGKLPKGTYLAFLSLEWIDDEAEKTRLAQQLTKKVPGFAPAYKEYALGLSDHTASLAALEQGLGAKPDAETRGFLLINKALTLNAQGQADAGKKILGELALDDAAPMGVQHSAKKALGLLLRPPAR